MKKFVLPLALAVTVTIDTESCDPETVMLAEEGLEKMNEIMTGGTSYEFADCTLVIRDNADLISETEEESMVARLTKYLDQSEVDVLIMTTQEIGLSSLSPGSTYAQMYLPAESEEWICLTYDQRRGSYHIYYDGMIAKRAIANRTDLAFDAGMPYFRDKDYAKGLEEMAKFCLKHIIEVDNSHASLP